MIKKLRRKFAIINMSLVAVILCVVLGMFCFTRIHAFRAESEIAMRHSVHIPERPSRKKTCHICLNVLPHRQIASPHGRRLWTWSCHRSDHSKKPPW